MYWQSYGLVAPSEDISGVEEEYLLSAGLPQLISVKSPAPQRDPRLARLLRDYALQFRTLNLAAHSPEDSQCGRNAVMCTPTDRTGPEGLFHTLGGSRTLLKAEIPLRIVTCPPASIAARPLAAFQVGSHTPSAEAGVPGSG